MLREPIASRRRRIAGNAAVAALASFVAFAAWSAQPPAAAQTISPGDDVTMRIKPDPSFVGEMRLQPPPYPREALDERVGGTVKLLVDLAADGRITGISIEDPESVDPRLAKAVAKAAWDWKFNPQLKDGKPVAGRVRVPVTFTPADPKQQAKG